MDLESLLGACKSLSDEELLELKSRMDALSAHHDEKEDADAEFRRKQKQVLKSMVTGKADKIRLKTEKVRETPEQKKAREMRELVEKKRLEAEQERLEMGDTGPKLSRAEQMEQAKLSTRKAKAGVRQTKNGASKHKVRPRVALSSRPGYSRLCVVLIPCLPMPQFDLETHNQRRGLDANGKKVQKQEKVICPCGCGKMIAPELYKTGAAWHKERNSVAVRQQKIANKLKAKGK